ncbi:two-component system QseEF-associated lipoprotein QseG [Enterobacteriaceae bacterium YMB-R21]|jgi:hypothetical protein|uniref:Two-component system QseEF-associated lipoprotein QseG n=2 Tax=Tenebrionicola larvae TaxID=2815733 RepID=A0A949Q4I0_9ENTR|nr:two-component system QseEF-associated lipoprotein QseG [Tenebrionicola larvae]
MKKMMIKAAWRSALNTARRLIFPAALLLAGCMADKEGYGPSVKAEAPPPLQKQMTDYLNVDCQALWHIKGQAAETNPLYWLRGIGCAERLSPADARALARRWDEGTWQAALRQSILLAKARITPQERRLYTTKLDNFSYDIPGQVRPLFQLWRDGQLRELELVQSRGRYAALQQSADRDLDALRQREKQLRAQLEQTTRQLQNLTDIERQLSNRKTASGYLPTDKNEKHDELTAPGDKKRENAAQPEEITP